MKLTRATIGDAEEINALLNLAYRGERGWTTEHSLVEGNRSAVAEIKHALENPQFHFLILRDPETLIACIGLEPNQTETHIGTFAVHPSHQSNGLGKRVLAAGEAYAVEVLGARKFVMFVLSPRSELIAFYERRGYALTGQHKEFPLHSKVGVPKISNLMIEELSKVAKISD